VLTRDFDYPLPSELIAQAASVERDRSRLMVLERNSAKIFHKQFRDLREYLRAGDVLVLNDSKVIPARLRGANAASGGKFEILLVEENARNDWWAMLRPGKRAREGTEIILLDAHGEKTDKRAVVIGVNEEGHRRLKFSIAENIRDLLDAFGEMPVPPYIARKDAAELEQDKLRYQTVYAAAPGSVAAPTAGLHFTEKFLEELRAGGVRVAFVTLHVGLGTFAPVKSEDIAGHVMHEERYEVSDATAELIYETKRSGRRVIAAGTTSVRVLESVASQNDGRIKGGAGRTRIFIYPPYRFRLVDGLLTNFHLPRSTLLMLVSAFASPGETGGRELVLRAYAEAVRERYRFYSYGDAMLII
jgi:S-adenosylmethionine:tRNA ribosyltransferase-isomerase